MSKKWIALGVIVVGVALGVTALLLAESDEVLVRGVVFNADGPVRGALVRAQAGPHYTHTDAEGRFELALDEPPRYLTAWVPDHLIGWTEDCTGDEVTIEVVAHYSTDNPAYDWFSGEGDTASSLSCSHCLPCYDEWQADAHSTSATNPRFLSLYNGTTLDGTQGRPTEYVFDAEIGVPVPVAPSLGMDEAGPGFRLDYPDLGGNCAACHAPGAAALPGGAYHVDMNALDGIALEGVFCEFCHKIGAVYVDEAGMPDGDLPGVLSMRLYRPGPGEQVFFGNFDDVAFGRRVTYLPLIEESQFCASCHFGEFWGTVAYNSYGEWLASPYSDPDTGQTCQDCHMPPVDYNHFVLPEQGGQYRADGRIKSHLMPGALDAALLQDTAEIDVEAAVEGERLLVTVRVTNSGAGHHVPTDNPLRNMILLVTATDATGATLPLLEGPTIPEWGGVGDAAAGNYAGLPGVLYAKILRDVYTGEMPNYAYWRQSEIVSDNRLPALATDETTYVFGAPSGAVTVEATLWLRRAFKELMDVKAWDVPDQWMGAERVTVGEG